MKSAKENLPPQQDSEVENIHEFSLKPLNEQTSFTQVITVDFTPQISESKLVSIIPKLNQSKDCFQPLFQSAYIKTFLDVSKQIPEMFRSLKQGPSKTPISQRSSFVKNQGSKPRPTSKYCQLCKQKFNEDYLDHIKHIVHLNNLKANPFQKYIQSLVLDFKLNHNPKRFLQPSAKDDEASGKQIKKLKEDIFFNKNDSLNIDFPYKQVNSTESTNNSSAIDPSQKKQALNPLKE